MNGFWVLVARYVGNGCPLLVHWLPIVCSQTARRVCTERTAIGLKY